MRLDDGFGVAGALLVWEELNVVGSEDQRIIVAHNARVLEAEDRLWVEPIRPGSIRRRGIVGWLSKPAIVAREKLRQKRVRPIAVVDAC